MTPGKTPSQTSVAPLGSRQQTPTLTGRFPALGAAAVNLQQSASVPPSTSFGSDHVTDGFLRTCVGAARSGTPTQRSIMRSSLEFTQRSKNTREEIPPFCCQAADYKGGQTMSLSGSRNHPRQLLPKHQRAALPRQIVVSASGKVGALTLTRGKRPYVKEWPLARAKTHVHADKPM